MPLQNPILTSLATPLQTIEGDIKLIFNRYVNSCNHLDSQIWRIIQYLEQTDLLKSTIVLITGDHGEEFMEKGRWGHNSNPSEEQTRTPLVLWIQGIKPHRVTYMSCHLNIPATLLSLMGVTNPLQDYSFGFDLLGYNYREFTIVSSWDMLAYVDS
jgi:membrane-anchored protein YejM (alkaline phosphatase superfamily)